MLGLRLSSGIHVPGFLWRFGDDALDGREALVAQLEAVGLLERHDEWLRLSPRGAAVANDVLCRLL